jgi:hypothetical protein
MYAVFFRIAPSSDWREIAGGYSEEKMAREIAITNERTLKLAGYPFAQAEVREVEAPKRTWMTTEEFLASLDDDSAPAVEVGHGETPPEGYDAKYARYHDPVTGDAYYQDPSPQATNTAPPFKVDLQHETTPGTVYTYCQECGKPRASWRQMGAWGRKRLCDECAAKHP